MNNGLINIGNTCYLNSILQCLFSLDNFRSEIQNLQINDNSLNNKLRLLFEELGTGNSQGNPKEILRFIISKGFNDFRLGRQCDSYEVLVIILDILHNECRKLQDWDIYYHYTKSGNELINKSRSEMKKLYEKEYSHIYKIFGSQICSKVYNIKTEKIEYNFEYFTSISVPIKNGDTNLNECLSNFFSYEKINEEFAREYIMYTYPSVLIINLKRFNNNNMKINLEIEIPEIIDISKYTRNSNVRYSLKCISKHFGSTKSGHYISECLYNNNWYNCNDSSVNNIQNYTSNSSYCLFFSKIQN